jgi:hypothetical protein
MKLFAVATAPPNWSSSGRMTEHRGKSLLINSHGTGKIRLVWKGGPPGVTLKFGNVKPLSVTYGARVEYLEQHGWAHTFRFQSDASTEFHKRIRPRLGISPNRIWRSSIRREHLWHVPNSHACRSRRHRWRRTTFAYHISDPGRSGIGTVVWGSFK